MFPKWIRQWTAWALKRRAKPSRLEQNNLLLIEGSVPGGPNAVVVIRKAVAAKVVKVAQVDTKKKGKK